MAIKNGDGGQCEIVEKEKYDDPVLRVLHRIIKMTVRVLAILMVAVIMWGIGDVIYILYQKLIEPPFLLLNINDILATFGAFLAVLIAIEIFENITLYLRDDIIHVKLVVATALMAIARKVIVFDFNNLEATYVYATAAVVLSLGITHYLVSRCENASYGKKKNPACQGDSP